MAQPVQDEGFHEIQLNGKQLVFLFMAATVVSVVIFLCGVLVGRGVRAERGIVADSSSIASAADPTPAPPASTLTPPAGSDPTAAPPPVSEELGYYDRLQKSNGPKEQLKPVAPEHAGSETASTVGKAAAKPASERSAALPDKPERAAPPLEKSTLPAKEAAPMIPGDTAPAPASVDGFAVQIAALNVRSEADAIARRLSSKGYAAYVLSPANGTPFVFRVRVGKFPTRREAESVAAKLQKEEQFKPWVTR